MLKLKFKHLFLDIELETDESFAILGPNGSGKSLLLKVITHEMYPSRLYKREVFSKNLTLEEARRTFGVVNSELEYFYKNENITVFDAIISSFKNALLVYNFFEFSEYEKKAALELCDRFNLNPKADVSKLSLGEIKKTLIARAVIHNPKILCLDEPTNGLDIKAKYEFYDLIKSLKQKTILITHDFTEVKNYKKIFLLKKGRIVKCLKSLNKKDLSELFEVDEEKIIF